MILTVAFNHSDTEYYGSLCTKDGKPQIYLRIPKGKKQVAVQHTPKTPEEKVLAKRYRAFLKPYAIESQADFENHFLQCVREHILDTATQTREILQLGSYQEKIWTRDLIIRLAKRLNRRTPTKFYRRMLEDILVAFWKQNIGSEEIPLYVKQMGKQELCEFVNGFLGKPFTPAAVWQAAYRDLNLFHDGDPGPKPKPYL